MWVFFVVAWIEFSSIRVQQTVCSITEWKPCLWGNFACLAEEDSKDCQESRTLNKDSCLIQEYWEKKVKSHNIIKTQPKNVLTKEQTTPKIRVLRWSVYIFLEQLQSVWGNRKIHNSLFWNTFWSIDKKKNKRVTDVISPYRSYSQVFLPKDHKDIHDDVGFQMLYFQCFRGDIFQALEVDL